MKQKRFLGGLCLALFLILFLFNLSMLVISPGPDLRYWGLLSTVTNLLLYTSLLLLFIRYVSKVKEIFYLKSLLSEWRTEEELNRLDPRHHQVGQVLFHLLNSMVQSIRLNHARPNLEGKPAPIVLKNHRKEKVFFQPEEIEWIHADGNFQRVKTSEGLFKVRHTMRHLEDLLTNNSDRFMKVHRSWIVNIDKIRTISPNWDYVKIQDKLISINDGCREYLSDRLFYNRN